MQNRLHAINQFSCRIPLNIEHLEVMGAVVFELGFAVTVTVTQSLRLLLTFNAKCHSPSCDSRRTTKPVDNQKIYDQLLVQFTWALGS